MKQGVPLSFTVMVFPKYKDFVIAHIPLLYVKEKDHFLPLCCTRNA